MAPDANGGIPRLQHSGAAAPHESWFRYVPAARRLEIRKDAGEAVQIYETARLYREWPVHKELCDSQWFFVGSELAAEVYV